MASKDFMTPKSTTASTGNANTTCPPKAYGVPASPAQAAELKASSTEQKPGVSKSLAPTGAGAGRGNVNPPLVKPDNAYSHKTDNIVTSKKTTSTVDNFSEVNINAQFLPNVLDNLDAVTYHFKLFITSPDVSSSGKVLNTKDQIIIAESGVTDLTIDKVDVRTIATPSVESGTGTSTNIKFEIVEPSGAGLIDKIFYQSVALGIGNWAVMPVYLQLQFRARSADTSAPDDGKPGSLASLSWLWTLKISRIKANVTHVGTRYEFEAIVYDDFAQSNAIFTTQHNIVLNDLDKVETAMTELQNKLNADQILKLVNNYSIPDSFRIVVDPAIAKYHVTPPNNNTDSRRNDSFDGDYKNATFHAGTSVDKIIDTILGQTKEYQEVMLGAPTPGAEGLGMNQEPSQMKKFWRIITETRPLKFDPRRQDIAKEFTIFVVEYDIGVLEQNVLQNSAPPLTIEAQQKRLMTYVQKSILKKKYNYIFTGLNDQIINFDITINNAFANSQARFGGVYLNPFMADKGVVTHDHAEEEAAVTAALSKAISYTNSAKTANSIEAKAANEDALNKINASKLDESTKSRYKTLLDKSKPDTKLSYLSSVQRAGGINNNGSLSTSQTTAKKLATPVTEQVTQQQLTFISDVNAKSAASQKAYSEYLEHTKGKLRPIARIETLQDRQLGMGIESSSNSGIQKLSTMFAVALHSGLDSSLQKIKLTIKGDPFWIAPSPYTSSDQRVFNSLKPVNEAIEWIKRAHLQSVDSANLFGTDNFILVRFRTPRVFEGSALENNADSNSDVETLSGVYKVTVINTRFEAGKFTQELECMLDPEISILNISKQIEDDAKKKDKVATPEQSVQSGTVPATAVKQSRISETTSSIKGKITKATTSTKSTLSNIGTKLSSNIPSGIPDSITGKTPK